MVQLSRHLQAKLEPSLRPALESRWTFRKLDVLYGILLALHQGFLSPTSSVFAQGRPQQKRVLILYSFENEVGLYSDFDDSLRATLKSGGMGSIEFYTEFLDLARFPDRQHEMELRDVLRAKYSREKIDLIFPVSLPAITFILRHGKELFPGVPTLFCAVDRRWMVRLPLPANTTGVVETTKINKTLAAALRLQPDTRRVVVVGGTLQYERDWMQEIRSDLREYEGNLDFTYLTDLPMAELLTRLAHLPEHTVVLYMMMWRDGAGEHFLPKEALLRMVEASIAPVYGVFESFLGSGMVGGDLIPFKTVGTIAAEMGLHVLRGEKPAHIPVLSEDNATYIFDWRQLRRWHISEKRLPPGSAVLFRKASFWELYQSRIIVAILLISAETMLIALLLIQRRKRRQAERSLHISEARYRNLVESSHDWVWEVDSEGVYTYAGPQCRDLLGYDPKELIGKKPFDLMPPEEAKRAGLAFAEIAAQRKDFRGLTKISLHKEGRLVILETNGVPVFDDQTNFCGYRGMDRDITKRKHSEGELRESELKYRRLYESMVDGFVRVNMEGRITECNDAFQKLVSYEPQELLKLASGDLTREKWRAFETGIFEGQVRMQGHSEVYEKEYQRKDGTIVPVELRTHLMRDETGNACGMWSIVRDITERKRAEQALQEYEKAVESSQDMIAVLSREYHYLIANRSYLEHLGKKREQVIGHSASEVLGEKFFNEAVKKGLDECFAGKVVRYETKQALATLGECDLLVSNFPIESSTGIDRVCCVILDITERKRVEQGLHELGARILMVQEEERRHVARELHDDFSQRLALLAVDLEQLAQRPPTAKREWSARLQAMWSQTQELTSDLHRLSYQLHPSKLEDLGLVMALHSYCNGLTRQARLKVKLSDANVPRNLPKEVSLCIYRIVQESLHNVVKHSGVNTATVDLTGRPDEVRLVVSDSGKGFAPEAAGEGSGLGLVSIQERVRHVGGTCSIDSRPSGGTRIVVRIPVPSQQAQEYMAAG